jgi:hypothetical protein
LSPEHLSEILNKINKNFIINSIELQDCKLKTTYNKKNYNYKDNICFDLSYFDYKILKSF